MSIFGILNRSNFSNLMYLWGCVSVKQNVLFLNKSIVSFRRICSESNPKCGPWSVLFFGSDQFALKCLERLHAEYGTNKLLCRLDVVVGSKGKNNTVMQYANEHGIPVHEWPLQIDTTDFHLGLVVSFGHLIPSRVIQSFPLGMINVHGSLLPRWRGAAPIIYSLMNGESRTGVTIMKILPHKFDIGDIVVQQETDVHPDETMPELRSRLADLGADLLIKTVEKLPAILTLGIPQDEKYVTYAPKVTSKLALVKWNEMTAKNVYDLHRALDGLYQLSTKFQNKNVKLLDIKVLTHPPQQKLIPGSVMYDNMTDRLIVQCQEDSWISIKKVVVPGRPPMSARDFNNGFIRKHHNSVCLFEC